MNDIGSEVEQDKRCQTCLWWEASEDVCGRCFHSQSIATYTSPSIYCLYQEKRNSENMWYAFQENIGMVGKDKTKKNLLDQLGLQSSTRVKKGVYKGLKNGGKHPVYIYKNHELAEADGWK